VPETAADVLEAASPSERFGREVVLKLLWVTCRSIFVFLDLPPSYSFGAVRPVSPC
jgi:hypothetical protein